jgi:hypothetical protein
LPAGSLPSSIWPAATAAAAGTVAPTACVGKTYSWIPGAGP